ncbi:MAG: transposase [Lewinellaceae bacterium]|nr:transposase [Lewinellaceae bacterium]
MPSKIFYRRRLPHIQPPESSYSITCRLAGSLPKSITEELKEAYQAKRLGIASKYQGKDDAASKEALAKETLALRNAHFLKMDRYLDQALHGPTWLSNPEVARIVMESLHFIEHKLKYWDIWAYCVMANHVHLECTLTPVAPALNMVMKSHKSYTARQANLYLGRTGNPFWQEESFDRLIRDEDDFYYRIYYAVNNPVEAKLVKSWLDWPFTYVHPEIRKNIVP